MMATASLGAARTLRQRSAAQRSYYGIFTDADFFVLAIGADLASYRYAETEAPQPWLVEMIATANAALRKAVVPTLNGGWLLQPGGWRDHPDYRYAGDSAKGPGLQPSPLQHVAEDASHSSRWPLWLWSYESADSANRVYYDSLRVGLRRQLETRVLIPPGAGFRGWRLTNFMDGRNGVFRYGYRTHPTDGYGPYELSGTAFYGWWAMLGGSTVQLLYAGLADSFPYRNSELKVYLGPWKDRVPFEDGRYWFLCRIASALALLPNGEGVAEHAYILSDSERSVWSSRLRPILGKEIWNGPSAESAQYLLQAPLHFAFAYGADDLQRDFARHFSSFSESAGRDRNTPLLARLHYLYFASEFLRLASQTKHETLIPPALPARLESEIRSLWEGSPAIVSQVGWGEPPFQSYRDYHRWKLSLPKRYIAQ